MTRNDINNFAYYKNGLISISPPYNNIIVDKKKLLRKFKDAFYIRWESDFDTSTNRSYYHVIKDDGISLESLSSGVRNEVRKCLKYCDVRIVDVRYIVDNGGYEVYSSEYKRYKKKGFASLAKSKDRWIEGIEQAAKNGKEFWAAIYNNKVIAYSICNHKYEHVELVTWKADYANFKNYYPSYGLLYKMLEYYLPREDVRFVDDGGRSLTEHSNVQNFLIEKFGFRKAYTKLNVEFRWFLYPILIALAPFECFLKNYKLRSLVRLYIWSR